MKLSLSRNQPSILLQHLKQMQLKRKEDKNLNSNFTKSSLKPEKRWKETTNKNDLLKESNVHQHLWTIMLLFKLKENKTWRELDNNS